MNISDNMKINKKSIGSIKYSKNIKGEGKTMISNEILLIFFALPIAVIIISIALQRIFKNPILVAAIIFAIFLIVTFVIDNIQFLIATIAYTILSYITAFLTCVICRCINSQNQCCNPCRNENICDNNGDNNQVLGANGVSARINIIPNNNGITGNINGCYRRR